MEELPDLKEVKRKRRIIRPNREDLERFCPPLYECPHCRHWAVRDGYVCGVCGRDAHGKAMSEYGEMQNDH